MDRDAVGAPVTLRACANPVTFGSAAAAALDLDRIRLAPVHG
ncbi:hypothetical protein [Streptomyces sp. NPDC059161]